MSPRTPRPAHRARNDRGHRLAVIGVVVACCVAIALGTMLGMAGRTERTATSATLDQAPASPSTSTTPPTSSTSSTPSSALPPPTEPTTPSATTGPTAGPTADSTTDPTADPTTEPTPSTTEKPTPGPTTTTTERTADADAAAGERMSIRLTGYSWHDNTPAGSAEVANPILHDNAGGTGTYDDPITVAVPDGAGPAFEPGSRFYLPGVRRYVIVEDSGASEASSDVDGHLDMWVDGRDGSEDEVSDCMDEITGTVAAEADPPRGRPVIPGPIYDDGECNVP